MDALFNGLSYVFWVALALGILVFIHELGHFLSARAFGMRVDAFSLGFAPNLFRKTVGQTEYRLGAIPLGGYVKIAGMVDESMDIPYVMEPVLDVDGRPTLDDRGEPVMRQALDARGKPIPNEGAEPEPDEFRAKPVWQRMVVISAGVVFNLVLAFAIYSALAFAYGRSYTPAENVRLEISPGSIAEEMGFRTGDRIVAVNGEPVEQFEEVFTETTLSASPFRVTVVRDSGEVELQGPDQFLTRISRAQQEAEAAGETPSNLFGAEPILPPVLGSVSPGSAAEEAGLRAEDRILSIDGVPTRSWTQMTGAIVASGGEPMQVRWARPDSLLVETDLAPVAHRGSATIYEAPVAPRAEGDRFILGVLPSQAALGQRFEQLGLSESVQAGMAQTVGITTTYFGFIGKLFTGQESFKENVGGPLMIAKASKEAGDRGGREFWGFVAFLSIALAVFNILPIPALDGGHLVFLAYEAVARREPSLKVRMVVQQVGLALILALMVFVIFNDAVRWFG
jgi:regulator of sigma E protease